MDYQQALIAARNGNAVLFLGAGFSRGLYSVQNKRLPSGSELAEILCDKAGVKKTSDLGLASKRYLRHKSSDSLIDILRSYFLVNDTPASYSSIFKCPWRQVYTTNYDNVFEVGVQKHEMLYQSVDSTDIPRNSAGKRRVIHINGFIDSVRPDKLSTSFKLTNPSYLTAQFRESVWSEVFKRDINSAHAVFFVGYSLYDIDIQEILFESPELKEKTFFIEREDITEDAIEELDLDSFGTVINKGANTFAKDLSNVDPLALDKEELIVTSFSQPEYKSREFIIQDTFIFDLLLNGDLNTDLLYNDIISENYRYCIIRESFTNIIAGFNENENLLLHSGLANGKTIFAKQVSMYFYNKGYKIFEINDDYLERYAFNEVNKILEKYEKVLFVVENYTSNLHIISHIDSNRGPQTKLILTSRTYEHERVANEVFYSNKVISIQDTLEVSLDKLSEVDLKKISHYFDLYGIWGDLYAKHDKQKMEFLNNNANGEFHGILLGLLQSPQVRRRLDTFFDTMQDSNTLLTNIVAILTLSMSNITAPTLHMVAALTNSNEIFNKSFRETKAFKQLTTRNNSTVIAKSSALRSFSR